MIVWLCMIVGGVALDQVTKYLAARYLAEIGSIPLIQDVLHLTYVENTGAAFGMLKDHRWVFMTLSTLAVVLLGAYLVIML